MKTLFFFVGMLFFFCSIQAQVPNFNLTPIGNLAYTQELNDVWGYVDDTGIEYALVGTTTGTSIVSLANPNAPVELLFIPGSTSTWRDLKTWGDFAYVTCDVGTDGLLIIDLSPLPQNLPTYQFWKPTLTVNNAQSTFYKAHNLYIDEAGFCYIAGSNISSGETFILDVHSTPGSPIYLGATFPFYAHDAYTRGDTLWTSDIFNGTFSVYNVSNKTAPLLLANQRTPRDFTHNAWISDDGKTLFTTDEKANAWVASYDVSDLGNIQELDRYRTPTPNTVPHNTHTFNGYQVISYYTDGLIILDGSRPDNLVEVARYDTYDLLPTTGFHGAWGAYPYLPSGRILVTDMNTGLHVFQPNYQRACWLEGLVTDQQTAATLFGVEVKILNSHIKEETDLVGIYKTGIGTAGTYQVKFEKIGYIPQVLTISLTHGQVTTQNVQLVPATPFTLSGRVVDSLNQNLGLGHASLHFKSSLYEYTTTADANGYFNLVIYPDSDYEVLIGSWGHYSKVFDLAALDSTAIPSLIYPLNQGYRDEFALDLGWTQLNNAIQSSWSRDFLSIDITDLEQDLGDYCFTTHPLNLSTPPLTGSSTIISPTMDLSQMANPMLSFYYSVYHFITFTGDSSLLVYISNGTDSILLHSITHPNGLTFSKVDIPLRDFISLSNTMKVYFKAHNPNNKYLKVSIDLFEITDSTSTPIHAINPSPTEFRCSPNPFHNSIFIHYQNKQLPYEKRSLKVWNSLGQIVHQQIVSQHSGQLELGESWERGLYYISIGNQTLKIIKH